MTEDTDIDIFATDLYMYLIPRRIGIPHTSPARLPNPNEKALYTDDIGKAILILCFQYQQKFCQKFFKDYLIFNKEREAFMRYCAEIGFAMYDEEVDNVFESLFLVSAMILELVVFCRLKNFNVHFWYADFCWAEIFKFHFKLQFFEDGGWQQFRLKAQHNAKVYDYLRRDVYEAPGQAIKSHSWLTRFDCTGINVLPDSKCSVSSVANCKVVKNKLDEKKESEGAGKIQQELEEQIESETFEDGSDYIEVSSTVQAATTEIDNMAKSSAGTKSAMELGAIPKTRVLKPSKISSESTHLDNTELLEVFKNIISSDSNYLGKRLCEILSNGKNVELLMNDRRYIRLVTTTVETPEHRPSNEELLSYAQHVMHVGTSNNQPVDGFVPQTDYAIHDKHVIQQLDSFEERYDQNEIPKNEAISLPLNESSGVNNRADIDLKTREEPRMCPGTDESECAPLSKEITSEVSGSFKNMKIENEYDTNSLSQCVNFFKDNFGSKIDYAYTKEQAEMQLSSDTSFENVQNVKPLDETLDPLDNSDLQSNEIHTRKKKILGEILQQSRKLMLNNLRIQYSTINNNQADELSSKTHVFKAEKDRSQNTERCDRMKNIIRKYKSNAFAVLEKTETHATFPCNAKEFVDFKVIESISEIANTLNNQASANEAEMGNDVDIIQKMDDLDYMSAQKMRELVDFNHEHDNAEELANSQLSLLDKFKSMEDSKQAYTSAKDINLMEKIDAKMKDQYIGFIKSIVAMRPPTRTSPRRCENSNSKVQPEGSEKSGADITSTSVEPEKVSNNKNTYISCTGHISLPNKGSHTVEISSRSSKVADSLRISLQQSNTSATKEKVSFKSVEVEKMEDKISFFKCDKMKTIYVDLTKEDSSSSGEELYLGLLESSEDGCSKDTADESTDKNDIRQSPVHDNNIRQSPIHDNDEKIVVARKKKKKNKKRNKRKR